jgi:ubiquinone/menaquinone biosynthesis C-methylase UbiE
MNNRLPGTCPFCMIGKTQILFETCDRQLEGKELYSYVRCPTCSMVFLDPTLVWQERSRHYNLAYRGYFRSKGFDHRVGLLHYGFTKRMRIIAHFKKYGRLLDVGTGLGDFVSWLSLKNSWQAIGLEPIADAICSGYPNNGTKRIVGDALNMGLATCSIDVVTLWSALEHLQDPIQGLQECLRVLKPEGLLVLRTVNSLSWGASLFGHNWVGYDAPRIVTVFTPENLKLMVAKVGFTILELTNYFYDFFPYAWSFENYCHEKISTTWFRNMLVKTGYSTITRILTYAFFIVQRLARKNSFMTLVACKPSTPL